MVVAALLGYILHGLDFGRVIDNLRQLRVRTFLFGIAILAAGQALNAWRWKVLLGPSPIRYRDCLAFICVGASLNLVSPSSVLSDGTVAYWMGRRNKMVLQSMSTLLAARVIGMAAMLMLFLSAAPGHAWVFRELAFGWAPAKLLYGAAILVFLAAGAFLARRHKQRVLALINEALPALKNPAALAAALVLSLGVQACQFLMQYVGYRAMGIPVGFLDILFFSPIMTLLGMLPISIGGIGVREGLSIFFLTLLPGVRKEMLLAHSGYGYAVQAGLVAVNLLFALAVLGRPGKAPREP
jgi:uncharacterized membrane protein YbhN (UPF0104 family)